MNAPSAAVATQTNLSPVKPHEGTRGAFRWDDPSCSTTSSPTTSA